MILEKFLAIVSIILSVCFVSGCALSKSEQRAVAVETCQNAELAVQVLGSGGPIPDDDRASSGYLIWSKGKAKVMVDIGGGVFLRFGASGAKISDLDVLAISHLHADHVAGLSAFLKGGYFSDRQRPLPLLGPSGNERFPAVDTFLKALLDAKSGSYRYLSGYLAGKGLFKVEPKVLSAKSEKSVRAFENKMLKIDAVGIHHGTIPSIGYLVTIGGMKIAFTGDQSVKSTAFAPMIKGADLLIAHHVIPESATNLQQLHRLPSQLGMLAKEAGVKKMVLSHNMKRSLEVLEEGQKAIRKHYQGPLEVADDLSCYILK